MKKIILQMLLVIASVGFAQAQTRITGKIIDAEGKPLDIVTVTVKEVPTAGAFTDADGNYTINVPSGGSTLVFSYIGYLTQEVAIGTRSIINVTLESDAITLEESVTIGYMTVKKSTFTGAATVLKSDKIEKLPVASVDQALQGQVPGLQATTGSGQPGSATKLLIRGIGSVNAGTDPLYIVDGIPVTTGNLLDIAGGYNGEVASASVDLNPNDIETVNVLKDASATSIYGSRAANGVVVITTKHGRKGKTNFNFSSQAGISSRTNTGFRMVNRDEWIELARESYLNSGRTETQFNTYMNNFPKDANDNFYDTDWEKEAYRDNALTYQADFSARGGDDKTAFFFSLGRYSQEAVLKWGEVRRTSARLNLDHQGAKWLKFGVNSTYSYVFRDIPLTTSAYYINPVAGSLNLSPLEPVYNEDGSYRHKMIGNNGVNFVEANNYNIMEYRSHRLIGALYAELTLLKNLKFKTQYGYDLTMLTSDQWDDPRTTGSSADNLGRATRYTDQYLVQNITNTLQYNFTLKDIHNISILAGQEASDKSNKWVQAVNEGFPGYKLKEPSLGATPVTAAGSRSGSRLVSVFGQFNYDYDGKYYLSGSLRQDGSSKFGTNHKYATFWSVGLSWYINKEKFLESYDWINQLILRTSYGTSGNSEIGNYRSQGLYTYGAYNGLSTKYPNQIGYDDLRWEQTEAANIGVDFSVLNRRIGGTIEIYYNKTTDLLLDMPISYMQGVSSTRMANVGSLRNQGIEVSINAMPVKTKYFTWNIDANWSRNLNKILSLVDGSPITNPNNSRCELQVGGDLMAYKLVKYAGVNPADGSQMWYNKDGEIVFYRVYGNMSVTGIGSASPKGFGGITNTFTYKGFSLSAFFYFQYGNKIFDNVAYQYMDDGNTLTQGIVATQLDRWQKPGDITTVPKPLITNTTQVSTRYLFDGSYIRLKNVLLGYDFPAKWVNKIGLTGLRIFAQGQNLLTITKYPGQDPEVNYTGEAFYSYPTSKTWTLGIDVKF
ncbi:MAG: TonB-dependent receptor [Prevotellaceae bacterium]|jgi:TonB-linked SusC/RagA family outer membrane protein|nr:TonB-dependent receptor [Prevotellaceae bacterium]